MVNYSYLPDSDLIFEISNLQSEIHTTKSYESNRDLITSVENRYSANVISKFDYQNDPLGRRTQRIDQGGTGIPACVTNIFSYNSRSELTNALMPALSNVEVDERLFAYQYDPIGNRETSATNGATLTYTANELNQYTSVTSVQSVVNYSHDPDGNLTNDGAFVYTWDAENRLIAMESGTGIPACERKLLTFAYDYMGRRYSKKVYSWNSDSWLLTSDSSFIYDGWNLILETSTGVSPVGLHAIEGLIKINPNNSPDNDFSLALPDGSTITRDGLQQDFAGYSGPALSIHVKPAGGGSQDGLMVDGETYRLDNSETYNITSLSMTVNLYNDRVKKGKAMGRWWISIQATNATIIAGNVATIPNQQSAITNYYVWGLCYPEQ